MKITETVPLYVNVFRSRIDGRLVVQIEQDTDTDEPEVRVTLNDGTIFDGDTNTEQVLDAIEGRKHADALEANWESGNVATAVRDAIAFLCGGVG